MSSYMLSALIILIVVAAEKTGNMRGEFLLPPGGAAEKTQMRRHNEKFFMWAMIVTVTIASVTLIARYFVFRQKRKLPLIYSLFCFLLLTA